VILCYHLWVIADQAGLLRFDIGEVSGYENMFSW